MKRKRAILGLVGVLLLSGIAVAAGGVKGTTTNSMTTITKAGGANGPWTISSTGNVGIDSTVTGFVGLRYNVEDSNTTQTFGFTNLPNGPPVAGGAAVAWTGSVNGLTVADTYTAFCTMSYLDAAGVQQKITSVSTKAVP